ncbi:thiamine diphosphokinase [Deinococcus metallilatus]|uniref:Thiamine diphosphokinase n=1 Tax=Deinococcus metallilatus TaxID=1211322 RepID=A0AAJ5JYI4_9DEIO|nr:thiamine diphosphokinase [Deinococcus metallilatus]MBB5295524.1 thiamine pyrophosphokinase [Deinococcus metallilatus]QBY07962.1 thiamine diphosphokinase [Deinococcus metallilatus]RXJ12855.1 thiamine diphosphokinase [Deinococcus metallilatus]TLK27223.1 thiamine diphosphokinase [Deinococcus metallilatus]GMA16202.1 thiamine pyrophosphokinase [Deinococcus metallilatus]
MTAWLLVGGRLVVTPALLALPRPDFVVAADGGGRHAAALGVRVDAWVGDFDSSDGLHLNAPREVHPAAKDETDAELAVRAARERGATELIFLGAFGGRFDHTAALALGSLRLAREGLGIILHSGDESGYPLLPGADVRLDLPPGTTLSVLAVSDLHALSLSGTRWPLHDADVPLGSGWTVSNEAAGGPVTASLQQGLALVTVLWPAG